MSQKPRIFRGPASNYATMPGEEIFEFTDGTSGGLISMRRHPDGQLLFQVYNTDDDVLVTSPKAAAASVCTESGTRVHEMGADGSCVFCHHPLALVQVGR